MLIPSDAFSFSELPSEEKENTDHSDDLEFQWICTIEPTPFREGTSLEASPCDGGRSTTQGRDNVFKPKMKMDYNWKTGLSEALKEDLSLLLPSSTLGRKRGLEASPLPSKRARSSSETSEDQEHRNSTGMAPRFREYQDTQWQEQFEALLNYKQQFGHCNVPHTYEADLALSRWVKRQRYQYKLKLDGKRTSLSAERQQNLEEVGFVWDPHAALWEARRAELVEYKKREGKCNVPCRYAKNPQLGMWVRSQRREYKLLRDGQMSRLTPERYRLLDEMGFVWEPRAVGRTNKETTDGSF